MTNVANSQALIDDLANRFVQVARLGNYKISDIDLDIEFWPAPHVPKKLPNGKRALYGFIYNEQCLKVGKAGSNSNARYQSQHYNPKSANSNLAASIISDADSSYAPNLVEKNVGHWIKENCFRFNIHFDAKHSDEFATFMESFFIFCLKPKYEGRWRKK